MGNTHKLKRKRTATQDRLTYTLREAAELVGVAYLTLWKSVQNGDLRPIKGFKEMRISRRELDRFVDEPGDYTKREYAKAGEGA